MPLKQPAQVVLKLYVCGVCLCDKQSIKHDKTHMYIIEGTQKYISVFWSFTQMLSSHLNWHVLACLTFNVPRFMTENKQNRLDLESWQVRIAAPHLQGALRWDCWHQDWEGHPSPASVKHNTINVICDAVAAWQMDPTIYVYCCSANTTSHASHSMSIQRSQMFFGAVWFEAPDESSQPMKGRSRSGTS